MSSKERKCSECHYFERILPSRVVGFAKCKLEEARGESAVMAADRIACENFCEKRRCGNCRHFKVFMEDSVGKFGECWWRRQNGEVLTVMGERSYAGKCQGYSEARACGDCQHFIEDKYAYHNGICALQISKFPKLRMSLGTMACDDFKQAPEGFRDPIRSRFEILDL